MHKRLFGEVASFDAFPSPTSGGGGGWWWSPLEPPQGGVPFQSVQFSQSVSSVGLGRPPGGPPKPLISYETIKVKTPGHQTWPLPPIKRALSGTDTADYEVAHLSPLNRNISPSVGTSEFGHFQKVSHFSQSVQSVQFSWFGEASRGTQKPRFRMRS